MTCSYKPHTKQHERKIFFKYIYENKKYYSNIPPKTKSANEPQFFKINPEMLLARCLLFTKRKYLCYYALFSAFYFLLFVEKQLIDLFIICTTIADRNLYYKRRITTLRITTILYNFQENYEKNVLIITMK